MTKGLNTMAHQNFVLLPDDDSLTNPTLLLVERPGKESERYRMLAKRAGFRVRTAKSAPMTRVISRRSRPDLVLLSPLTGPPGASELARSIKENPKTSDIPIMILVDGTDPSLSRVYPIEACASIAASDEDLIQTMRAVRSRRRTARREPEPSSPLEGDLADDTFPGVLEFLFATERTGRIVVRNGSRRPGHIYVEEGNVVHAEIAQQRGLDAFKSMCFLTRGRFKFEPEFRVGERTMTDNGIKMLLESARCCDELARARSAARG